MSSPAGWYPDPGGQPRTFRYWDGKTWSAATTTNPNTPPPAQSLVGSGAGRPITPSAGQSYGQGAGQGYGQAYGGQGFQGSGTFGGGQSAYSSYQQTASKKSPKGWWIGALAVVVVLVIVVVLAVRALAGGNGPLSGNNPGGTGSLNPCPVQTAEPTPESHPADGRVHGGPLSYPTLPDPWDAASSEIRLPFGSDVVKQEVLDQANYNGKGDSWVASVLVGRLQAGDGFFTPQQGSQIVVRCILGTFYGNAAVTSDVKKDQKATIDGHDAWIVESQLSFNITGLEAKGELLIVAIVAASATSSGIFYASIPDTQPELVTPARQALKGVTVDS